MTSPGHTSPDLTPSTPVVRLLTADDDAASTRLRNEAFGMRPEPDQPPPFPLPGATAYGTFLGDQLVTRLVDRDYLTHWGDRLIPTSGISGVTVMVEARGRGLLTDLFGTALASARDRGAVLSTLHPSAPAIYRTFGYEVVTDYVDAWVPTASLARIRPGAGITTRRADLDDVPAIREVYATWANGHNGPLSRTGPSFPQQEQWVRGTDAVTLAEDEGRVCGYLAWDRGTDKDEGASLEVADLFATSADAYRTLLHTLGQFAMVTPSIDFTSSGNDPLRLLLPANDWKINYRSPYMLRILDVEQAFGGPPPAETTAPVDHVDELIFTVTDEFLPSVAGRYALRIGASGSYCRRIEPSADATAEGPVFTARGLAAIYAGAHSCATLRATGLLSGTDAHDQQWNLVSGGRTFHVRDYF